MDERNYYFMNRSHIRAFGSWDCNDDFPIPFTECFESADLFRYSYSKDPDLYQNDIVTPAMIVLPPPKESKMRIKYDGVSTEKSKARFLQDFPSTALRLYPMPKRKGVRGFFSMCLRPTCAS
ncbi:uncharacterized protein LOC107768446 isoform X1 [Nicotiana tabacum]|uniref:Uncharacterized protein LOC107768446 isoform X1 n=1 Tax=Nicotiana tabacum TaxID=4097 RepID=A0A1S3XT59_TOBAC|nr:uncharacterized protein LOC104112157 isoform X1 [Nicotiana tomentosiformis]XP_016443060.1 PREDICTED: uncharacterized protein LOC107768446 isoform X1 [Nicotiana tabacum]